jgi:DNA-binding transcriptional MerR regulator
MTFLDSLLSPRRASGLAMKIGQLAQQTGTPVDTIRYYEREGLLPRAARTEGNYRIYDAMHLERLAFIRRCRSLT